MTSDTQTEKAVLAALIASFTGSQADKSEAVLAALIGAYRGHEGRPPSRYEIKEKVVAVANLIGYHGDVEGIVNSVDAEVRTVTTQ